MNFIEKFKFALPKDINFDDLFELTPSDLWETDPRKAAILSLYRSKIFDSDEYLIKYDDVRETRYNAIDHYIVHGIDEHREFTKANNLKRNVKLIINDRSNKNIINHTLEILKSKNKIMFEQMNLIQQELEKIIKNSTTY